MIKFLFYHFLLIHYFLLFITELARNKFKQIVNTLANISTEGGEKYLVLKRRFRVGTPLSESEYLASPQSPGINQISSPHFSPFNSPLQPLSPTSPPNFSPSSGSSPGIPPRYRAPPPYRPPPVPISSPQSAPQDDDLRFSQPPPNRQFHNDQRQMYQDEFVASKDDMSHSKEYLQSNYEEPNDLGIPVAPQIQRSSSTSTLYASNVGQYTNNSQNRNAAPVRPKSLSLLSNNEGELSQDDYSSSTSSLSTLSSRTPSSSAFTPTADEQPPPIPLKKRQNSWKENQRPSPEGQEAVVGLVNFNVLYEKFLFPNFKFLILKYLFLYLLSI